MAIGVQFGTCSCENEVVDKRGSVTLGNSVSCEMVNTDILNPILRVNTRIDANYCSISDFGGRFYYIETVEGIAGGHCLCHCHVDVLYSHCSAIKGLTCLVSRNENDRNDSIVDTMLPFKKEYTVYQKRHLNGQVLSPAGFFAYYLMRVAY